MLTVYFLILICVVAYFIMHFMSHRQFKRFLAIAKLSVFANFRVYKQHVTSDDEANLIAAAATNYRFGEEVDGKHQALDMHAVNSDASTWVFNDPLLRELVVQSLRVRLMLHYFKRERLNSRVSVLLKRFGKEFPHAPTLETYEVLVQKYFNSVDAASQEQLRLRFDF